jgi:hypothetical protein
MFEKIMKIQDCKEPPKAEKHAEGKDKDELGANGKLADDPKASKADTAKKEEEKKKKAGQSEQDIINMFAVDTTQVGVFGATVSISSTYSSFRSSSFRYFSCGIWSAGRVCWPGYFPSPSFSQSTNSSRSDMELSKRN